MNIIHGYFCTPLILKYHKTTSRNWFDFCYSINQKKGVHFWKNYFIFFYWSGMISYQWLDFRIACSMPAACLQLPCSMHRVIKVHLYVVVVTQSLYKSFVIEKHYILKILKLALLGFETSVRGVLPKKPKSVWRNICTAPNLKSPSQPYITRFWAARPFTTPIWPWNN